MNNKVTQAILDVVKSMMDRVMERVLITNPFIVEEHHANKPLYAALVPDEIFKGSHFERRFVTPFGSVWEKLAVQVALAHHGHCLQGASVEGTVGDESLRRIQEVLNKLEHGVDGKKKLKPDWNKELAYIKAGGGKPIPVSVTCDILIQSEITQKTYAFELKAPLPNSDQTKVSKEKMFKLLAMNEHKVDNAYYALLVILKILGENIQRVSAFTRTDDAKVLYLNTHLQYEEAVGHVKAGTGVKSESSLVISGTKGYIYVPAPWWKPDYFEIRYENPYDNKKLYFPFESSGLRYEIQCFVDNISLKSTERPISKQEMLKIIQIVDKYLR